MMIDSVGRTGMRSGYFCLMRSASALRFSVSRKGGQQDE